MSVFPTYFVFDLDGTLALSEHLQLKAWQTVCRANNIPRITAKQYYRVNGEPSLDVIAGHLRRHGITYTPELLAELTAAKRAAYGQDLHLVERNEAIAALLAALTPYYKTALVTSAIKTHALITVERLGLSEMFDVMVFGEDVKHQKPDPECYELAARSLGARPEECVVFEDSASGIAAAKQFGAHVVKVVG